MAPKSSKTPQVDLRSLEQHVRLRGFRSVAGIDEAGRGPLAGPVVAAAVVLPPDIDLPLVRDSKQLRPAQRESCFSDIFSHAVDVGTGIVEAEEIDRINILQAALRAMALAVRSLKAPPDYLLLDGPYRLPLPFPQEGIPGGDRLCLSVAAASIVAKVTRDKLMLHYHEQYPVYGFDRHKGYGTPRHMEALRAHGPCPLHRLSFRGVVDREPSPPSRERGSK